MNKRNFMFSQCYWLLVFLGISSSSVNGQTTYLHMGTSTDLLNGVSVTWNGQGAADSIKWGYTPSYEKGQFLASSRAAVTFTGNWFYYNFGNGITPSATIYYQIKDSHTLTWGTEQKYHTVAAIPSDTATSDFTFAAGGDSRDGLGEFTTIANSMYAKNPDFVIFPGDLTAAGNKASEWTTWFNSADSLAYNKIIFPCEGNHDAKAPNTYLNMFNLPTNGDGSDYNYYSYTYGNTLFIILNFEYGDVAPNNPADWSAQTTWMNNLLDGIDTNKIKWKVVSWHEPYYTVGSAVGDMSYAGWWPIFDKYGVDLILNCHDHNYQRFKPINQNVSLTAPVSKYGSGPVDGRCEIICGGAGAPLDAQTVFGSPFLETFQSVNSFVIVNETGCQSGFTKMHITAYNDAGNTILDSVTVTKPCVSQAGIEMSTKVGNSINVVPNPATNEITLQYNSSLVGNALIRINDAQGKMVKTYNVKKDRNYLEYKCNISGFAKGIYILSIFIGSEQDKIKVIVD
ncbi:MAG TPA: metallophosphoesterase [Bacteroidia bacterium]|nr:metallophosphoesterase [Bacteroidia bacterium]